MKVQQEKASGVLKGFGIDLEKGYRLPIGTISMGRKKIAEGKWVDVKSTQKKPKKTKEVTEEDIANNPKSAELMADIMRSADELESNPGDLETLEAMRSDVKRMKSEFNFDFSMGEEESAYKRHK